MGWNFRTPTPLDPDTDPQLPQADSSQDHDIPTGVSPTTAKLQDWIAWLRAHGVFYLDPDGSPGLIANDLTVGGDLSVTADLEVAGATSLGGPLAVGGDVTTGLDVLGKLGARGGFSSYPQAHGTISSNVSASDASHLHSFDGATSSLDVALQFDATTPGIIHCYCTSSSLTNVIEFRYSGILISTWPAGTNRPFSIFAMGSLLPEVIAYGGGATAP